MQAAPTAAARPDPVGAAPGMVASLVNAVLNPYAAGAPVAPVEPPTMWTLLAFVRREFEPTVSNESPTGNPLAGQITNGLVTDTPTPCKPPEKAYAPCPVFLSNLPPVCSRVNTSSIVGTLSCG